MRGEALVSLIPGWREGGGTLPEALERAIETAILNGRVPRGVPLPSERSLAQALPASRVTVAAAYAGLRAGGWVETRRGAGSRARLPDGLDAQIDPGAPVAEGAIDLGRAAPMAPLPSYLAALGRAASGFGRHGRNPVMGAMPELREAIADRYRRQGLPTAPEQVLITSGAGASLSLAVRHGVSPGAKALVESPTFPGALEILRSARLRLLAWPMADGWDVEAFGSLVKEARPAAAYLVLDFHNPTGALASGAEREAIAAEARRTGTTLLIDEAMRDMDLRGPGSGEIPQLPDEPGVLRLGSLDKTVWAGLCVGWLRGPAKTIKAIGAIPETYYMTPPILEQLLALELLRDLEELIAARRRQLAAQLEVLIELVEATPELTLCRMPTGGLTGWLELPAGISSGELTRRAPEHGLHLLPGGRFSPDGTLDRFLRLPFTLPPDALRAAGKRLGGLLAETRTGL